MKHQAVLCLLLITVGARPGGASVVNLWDEAYLYIRQLQQELHNIDGWGLTADYAYWNRTPAPKEHPIYGRVEKMECVASSIETDRETVPPTECTREIVWNITNRIRSPFHLNASVLVPMISRSARKQNFTLDINNHTVIIMRAQSTPKIPGKREVRKIVKSCRFETNAYFNGWFAYHTTGRGDSLGNYRAVGVGNLKNQAKNLTKQSDHQLGYTVSGLYTETTCRPLHQRPRRY